jgi:hypothetical protein
MRMTKGAKWDGYPIRPCGAEQQRLPACGHHRQAGCPSYCGADRQDACPTGIRTDYRSSHHPPYGCYRSADPGITLSCCWSISKGSACIDTRMMYFSTLSDGTRHEYPQVKPHPYSNCPCWTTWPLGSLMVNCGLDGRLPPTIMSVHCSPPEPTRAMPRRTSPGAMTPSTRTTGL